MKLGSRIEDLTIQDLIDEAEYRAEIADQVGAERIARQWYAIVRDAKKLIASVNAAPEI